MTESWVKSAAIATTFFPLSFRVSCTMLDNFVISKNDIIVVLFSLFRWRQNIAQKHTRCCKCKKYKVLHHNAYNSTERWLHKLWNKWGAFSRELSISSDKKFCSLVSGFQCVLPRNSGLMPDQFSTFTASVCRLYQHENIQLSLYFVASLVGLDQFMFSARFRHSFAFSLHHKRQLKERENS